MSSVPGNCGPSSIPVIPVAFGPARRRSRPPFPDVVHQSFAATPTAARWARRHTGVILAAWNATESEAAVMQIVSELVANAAARPNPHGALYAIRLTLRLLPDRISIEVFDPDSAVPVLTQAHHDAERGRGLAIVSALACGLGVLPVPHGKIVVAQVQRADHYERRW